QRLRDLGERRRGTGRCGRPDPRARPGRADAVARSGRVTGSQIAAWLDPAGCPDERPPVREMGAATRELYTALDQHARATGVAWLLPERRTILRDLLGLPEVV